MEAKITRKELIREDKNSMVYNHFWLIHGRIWDSPEKKYTRKFKFIVWLDIVNDLWDDELEEDQEEKDVLDEISSSYIDMIPWDADFFDDNAFRAFYEICNDTILRYNEMNKAAWAY